MQFEVPYRLLRIQVAFRLISVAVAAFLAIVLHGCAGEDAAALNGEETSTVPHADASAGISWFRGGVDSAFDAARAEGKPVFLYWGAVWCPYCADLKAHVFSRPDFQEKLELFVPVYLDGDDPGAQKWGEEFGVWGYPTVLALDADRGELARIAGGMDILVYTEMLDLVLGDVRPLRDILLALDAAAAPSGQAPLSRDDCRRLAYNGWVLDDSPPPLRAGIAAVLAEAAERCPADAQVERARLTAVAASYAARDAGGADFAAASLLADLVDGVRAILAEPQLAAAVADALQYLDADFFTAAHRLAPQRSVRLLEQWSATMDTAAADNRFTAGDRLAALRSKLQAVQTLSPSKSIPAPLAEQARQKIEESLMRAEDTPALPGVVNAAVNLLVTLEEPERAYRIAEEAMQSSKTPYYYMADLAWLDEQMGRFDSAVAWLARAYEESTGAATRFQWGTNYVRGLVRMRQGDADAIRDAAIGVLGELDAPGQIYRRTRTRLESLDASLREWNAGGAYDPELAAIRQRMKEICGRLPEDEPEARESCSSFLSD